MKIRHFVLPTLCALTTGLASPVFGLAPTTGKFVFTFTVFITSPLPKDSAVVCYATASVNESGGLSVTQTATGIAIPSGSKATCIATMPYSWLLGSPHTDRVLLSYKVEVDYGYEITASNGTGTAVELATSDKVAQDLLSISVPVDGSTTNTAVSAVL